MIVEQSKSIALARQISKIADYRLMLLGKALEVLDHYVLDEEDLKVYEEIDKELNGESYKE